jgi:hypothetical protein
MRFLFHRGKLDPEYSAKVADLEAGSTIVRVEFREARREF